MRICLYTETALPKIGGQEMVVDALARQFLALGHEPIVLAPQPSHWSPTTHPPLPYRVERHPKFVSTRYFVSWYRWFLQRHHQQYPFDVLHCHSVYPTGYLAGLCKEQFGVPLLITSHGGDVYEKNIRLAKPGLRERHILGLQSADAVLAISRFTEQSMRKLSPEIQTIRHLPNGVHLEPYAVSYPRPEDLDPAIQPGKYVLFLGRLAHRKGIDLLINAVSLLPSDSAIHLVIAGDGQERAALELLCERLGVGDRVTFTGAVSGNTKYYLLQNARFGVVCSRTWEAFGLVVLEHHAAGLPVIATRLPGLEDLVDDRRTGLVVPPESPMELADAMRYLLENPGRVKAMGEQAQQTAQHYSWRVIAERHIQLYRELLETRKSMAA